MSRADDIYAALVKGGEAAIDQFITDYQSENLWLDFKRSADNGSGAKLHLSDRENLAKAISGFGNSDGGVIVWGVDCRRDPKTGADLPQAKVPIVDPARFVSWLENVITSCTAPAHSTVEHFAVNVPGAAEGFVVTLIPMSMNAPHQCIQPTTDARYYMRVGSNFAPVPHAVLSGLFGRRPQPRLALKWLAPSIRLTEDVVTVSVTVALSNVGRAIARDLYLNVWAYPPGPNCRLRFGNFNDKRWEHYGLANLWNLIATEGYRVAPNAHASVGVYELQLQPPFDATYSFNSSYGCEAGERRQGRIDIPPDEMERIYRAAVSALRANGDTTAVMEAVLRGA